MSFLLPPKQSGEASAFSFLSFHSCFFKATASEVSFKNLSKENLELESDAIYKFLTPKEEKEKKNQIFYNQHQKKN